MSMSEVLYDEKAEDMLLLDIFAGEVIQSLITSTNAGDPAALSKTAYVYAKEMMIARQALLDELDI